MLNYLKTLLGFSLLALIGVWIGCSSKTSPVASSNSASKTAAEQQVVIFNILDSKLERVIKQELGLDPTHVMDVGDFFYLKKLGKL